MKTIREMICEKVHYNKGQIESCLKVALKGIKNGLDSKDLKLWEDWESASRAIAQLLQNAEDPETAQYIIEYIAKNY